MVKHIEIENHEGRVLRGYLHKPEDFNGTLVIMFHGFTGNKTEHGGHFRDFSRLLEANQIASLRMDFSGNGESDGKFSDFTFDTLISEANLFIDYGKSLAGVKEIVLLGFSMGGAIAAMVGSKRKADISKMILWSPAANILDIIRNKYEISNKFANGDADFGNYPISKAMYDSLNKYNVFQGLEVFDNQVLIIHGKKDLAVNYEYSYSYLTKFKKCTLHIIESAGHGYDKSNEKEELLQKSYIFLRG